MRLAPSAQIFRHSAQIGYILVIFLCFGGIAASQLSHRIFPIYF